MGSLGRFGVVAIMASACQTLARAQGPIATVAGDYRVRIEHASPPRVVVEADLQPADGVLLMATGGGIDHLPNQWATFVEGLRATDQRGRALTLESRGPEGWRIVTAHTGRVRLTYQVNLSFTTQPWPPGNEQAGVWLDSTLYMITKPLFVASTVEGPRRVAFSLPAGWRISTPWVPDPQSPGAFLAPTREELMENSVVAGRHREQRFERGPFTLTLALLGDLAAEGEVVAATLDAVARHVNRVFPQSPPARYLVTLFRAHQDDGESFTSSAAFTTATRPTRHNIMLWGNNLAHEVYHIWIGGPVRGSESGVFEWFDEGFTDYYADLALVQSGIIEPATFLRKAEKVLGRYAYWTVAPVFQRQSMFDASPRRGTNRFGVYDGGWAAAFCLDGLVQEASGNARALDDVMRSLHERFALLDHPFSREDFVSVASQAAGTSLADFFARHIAGVEPLPLEACLARAGLEGAFQRYAGELWIAPSEAPSAMQSAIFRRIVEGPPRGR